MGRSQVDCAHFAEEVQNRPESVRPKLVEMDIPKQYFSVYFTLCGDHAAAATRAWIDPPKRIFSEYCGHDPSRLPVICVPADPGTHPLGAGSRVQRNEQPPAPCAMNYRSARADMPWSLSAPSSTMTTSMPLLIRSRSSAESLL